MGQSLGGTFRRQARMRASKAWGRRFRRFHQTREPHRGMARPIALAVGPVRSFGDMPGEGLIAGDIWADAVRVGVVRDRAVFCE